MNMVRHDDEFMQQIFSFVAIMRERVDQKVGGHVAPEDWLAMCSNGGDEEYAIAVHLGMLAKKGESCL